MPMRFAAGVVFSMALVAGSLEFGETLPHHEYEGIADVPAAAVGYAHGDADDHHDNSDSPYHHHVLHCCCAHVHSAVVLRPPTIEPSHLITLAAIVDVTPAASRPIDLIQHVPIA